MLITVVGCAVILWAGVAGQITVDFAGNSLALSTYLKIFKANQAELADYEYLNKYG